MKRNLHGFFSVFAAALAAMIFVFAAGNAFSFFDLQRASLTDLEMKIASDKFADAKEFFPNTMDDAILVYSYGTYGCNPQTYNDDSFCTGIFNPVEIVNDYLDVVLRGLDDPSINVRARVSMPSCGNVNPNPNTFDLGNGEGPVHRARDASFSADIYVNSSISNFSYSVTFDRMIFVKKGVSPGEVFDVHLYKGNDKWKNITVTC
ncbi:MAG: hypothetical protein ACE5DI_04150 [Candidatus Micrarchaeia archaeon]